MAEKLDFATRKAWALELFNKYERLPTHVYPDEIEERLGSLRNSATPGMRRLLGKELLARKQGGYAAKRRLLKKARTETELSDFIRLYMRYGFTLKEAYTKPNWNRIFLEVRGNAGRTIAQHVTRAYLSPHTQLGRRRLEREFRRIAADEPGGQTVPQG
jgi:hypothetical protein